MFLCLTQAFNFITVFTTRVPTQTESFGTFLYICEPFFITDVQLFLFFFFVVKFEHQPSYR